MQTEPILLLMYIETLDHLEESKQKNWV